MTNRPAIFCRRDGRPADGSLPAHLARRAHHHPPQERAASLSIAYQRGEAPGERRAATGAARRRP